MYAPIGIFKDGDLTHRSHSVLGGAPQPKLGRNLGSNYVIRICFHFMSVLPGSTILYRGIGSNSLHFVQKIASTDTLERRRAS